MHLIAAVDQQWGLGYQGDLLFHILEDMRFFRSKTLDKTIVMGRKTLLSFPGGKPLPRRHNIVFTRNQQFTLPDVSVCRSLTELHQLLASVDDNDVFVVGGAAIYALLLPYCKDAFITHVDATRPADRYFPDLSKLPNWKRQTDADRFGTQDGIAYTFTTYSNTAPIPLLP